jgi:phosphate acetyltransferase
MFTYELMAKARKDRRRIVLAEGEEPRILKAAHYLMERDLMDLILIGRREAIERVVRDQGIEINLDLLRTVDPSMSPDFERYAQAYQGLRAEKGVSLEMARDLMMDVGYFATMMVHLGDADGMVSGAIHTTQETIRPALQCIGTREGCGIVSSVFFMCLEDGVLVYGDCAINPEPSPQELAEIAVSSADTAQRFGLVPVLAMLSYSSGDSGKGSEVDKVRSATRLAQEMRPDLEIEGPIQYDAAVDAEVAAIKMPLSKVAGRANVLIFPDLNTGNNTYKAVQRETGALAIGPILQGLKKPVNDLSRGCSVEDIINTAIITAIQAQSESS